MHVEWVAQTGRICAESYAVGLDGTERKVFCGDGELGEQVEGCTLAYVRQSNDTTATNADCDFLSNLQLS